MNPNNAPSETSPSASQANTEILDEIQNISKGDASLNKPTRTDFEDVQDLICNRFGFSEQIYKRIVGKNDL